MKKTLKNTLLILIIIFINNITKGQTWEFVYNYNSIGRDLIASQDSCFVITGTLGNENNGLSFKIDSEGSIVWSTPRGGYAIIETYDYNYITAGALGYYNAFLRKIDKYGNIKWTKNYGGTGQDEFHTIIQDSDSCLVAAGFTTSFGDSTIYIVKTDSVGNLIWQRSLMGFYYGGARDIIEINNEYYFVGAFQNYSNFSYMFIAKLNKNGNTIWRKDYPIGFSGNSITLSRDSSLYIVGQSVVTKLDLNGDTIWVKTIDESWNLLSVDATFDNGIIVAGTKYNLGYNENNLISKLNSNGEIIWHHIYNGGTNGLNNFSTVLSLENNEYIAGGTSTYSQIEKIRIIKTDENGEFVHINEQSDSKIPICIFPNPTYDNINISGENISNIEIFDFSGRKLISCSSTNMINIACFQKGIYVIRITSTEGVFLQKITKL